MIKHSQGSATGKEFVLQFFLRKSGSCCFRVELQEFCMCFTQTKGYLFEHRVWMNTLFKIFYFYITGGDSQRVLFGTWTIDPAPFISHACIAPQFLVAWRNVVLGKVSTVVRAVVHCLDAFPRTTGLRNANEACAGSPRQKPNPSHHLDWLMCVTMWEQGVAFHA